MAQVRRYTTRLVAVREATALLNDAQRRTAVREGPERRAVLLMAYGGPASLDEIPGFLESIRGSRPSTELVERITERYRLIGGRSPLPAITRSTADRLTAVTGLPTYVGMRHWRPLIEEVVLEMAQAGVQRALTVCMAPHYSAASVGAYHQRTADAARPHPTLHLELTSSWHLEPRFISGLAENVLGTIERFEPAEWAEVGVLFTAHSLPRAALPPDDPYQRQLLETGAAVATAANLAGPRWRLAYQSASGPADQWLGPSAEEVLAEMAADGCRHVVVCPAGFVAEQVEIFYDIDIRLNATARGLGVWLERTPMLNDGEPLVAALAALVKRWEGEEPT